MSISEELEMDVERACRAALSQLIHRKVDRLGIDRDQVRVICDRVEKGIDFVSTH